MNITIEKLHESDDEQLFQFELENRFYFEGMIPSRGDEYYSFANFKTKNKSLLDEQSKGLSYFYLIKNEESQNRILQRKHAVLFTNCIKYS